MLKETVQPPRQSRSRWLRWGAFLVLVLCWLPSSCRRDETWSGAEFVSHGTELRVSSEEPFCGCIHLQNALNERVYVRSRVELAEDHWEPVTRGHAILAPTEDRDGGGGDGKDKLDQRFDWGGLNAKDVYLLDAWSADGKPLVIRDAVRLNGYGWPFQPCEKMLKCPYGSLFLNTGEIHHH